MDASKSLQTQRWGSASAELFWNAFVQQAERSCSRPGFSVPERPELGKPWPAGVASNVKQPCGNLKRRARGSRC